MPRVCLLLLLVLPLVGAVVVAALGPRRLEPVRWISLGVSVATLVLALIVAGRFMGLDRDAYTEEVLTAQVAPTANVPTFSPVFVPGSTLERQHATTWDILPIGSGAIQFYIGLDGLNVWMVVLTGILFVPSVLVSWHAIQQRVNEFYAWLLLLQTGLFGVFLSFDIILFYVFFELTLVPLFFLIGIWGGPERRHAARKFFIYTLAGSLITLLGVLGIVAASYPANEGIVTFSIPRLVEIVHTQLAVDHPDVHDYWQSTQFWVFLALMAGLAVKVPLVPFHTWLPLAHVEAPTAGSVDLAGVLLKIGAYGFLRLCVPLAPDVSLSLGLPLVTTLAAIGVLYGAFCAYSQDDIKKLVAYSSVSHLGVCMLGMFALTATGVSGSLMVMINHGLSTAALFLLVGMLYDRYHTRKISDYGGMGAKMPLLACFMIFICMSSVGLPFLNGFIGEFLVISGVIEMEWIRFQGPILIIVIALGIILGAWYLLTMVRHVFFGPVKEPPAEGHQEATDLTGRELAIIVPIAALCLFIGVYPQPVLKAMQADVDVIQHIAARAREREHQGIEAAARPRWLAPLAAAPTEGDQQP
ncbi:MAG: NuoM family protein [Gemmataceae bacterium]